MNKNNTSHSSKSVKHANLQHRNGSLKDNPKEKVDKVELIVLSVLLVIGIPFYILTERDAISSLLLIWMIAELFVLLYISKLKNNLKKSMLLVFVALIFITVVIEKYALNTGNGVLHGEIRILILAPLLLTDIGLAIYNTITQRMLYKIISISIVLVMIIVGYYMIDTISNPVLWSEVWLWNNAFKPIFKVPFS